VWPIAERTFSWMDMGRFPEKGREIEGEGGL